MRKILILAAAGLAISVSNVRAQVDLSAYADAEGFINVQALTCAQLAGTWQGDADTPHGTAAGTTGSQKNITWILEREKKPNTR